MIRWIQFHVGDDRRLHTIPVAERRTENDADYLGTDPAIVARARIHLVDRYSSTPDVAITYLREVYPYLNQRITT